MEFIVVQVSPQMSVVAERKGNKFFTAITKPLKTSRANEAHKIICEADTRDYPEWLNHAMVDYL